ncbi:MAG: alpha-amylase family glycosyl hydrolase [Fimbriimonadales bacterium]|nr:alpha-amylase family glycosyl hydrolase [Fimbriimonadales bacterium]
MIVPLAAALLLASSAELLREFRYVAAEPVESVAVAGSFNGWSRDANPLRPDADRRVWRIALSLPIGRHSYKFVLDGRRWVRDPANPHAEDDGFGGENSILWVLPPEYGRPARVGDGRLTEAGVAHRPTQGDAVWDRGRLLLTVRTRPGDVRSVAVEPIGGRPVELQPGLGDEFQQAWKGALPWDRRSVLRYRVLLRDGSARWTLGEDGLRPGSEARAFAIRPEQAAPLEPPAWVERTVFYQIFPDRFDNGDPSNDPPTVEPWDAPPKWYTFLGGDLEGVRRRLPYLAGLGVGAVYLNPIFVSPSAHGYETTDYLRVEPRLGTNDGFARLTRELKAGGIRTVLDGVFNHTSVDFFAFADLRRHGEGSRYRGWYTPHSFPIRVQNPPNYHAWFNFPSMPKLNHANPEARAHLLAVPGFWMERAELAGWRLDVADEVPSDFWRDFRRVVKAIDPQAWIVGEVWGDARRWLGGDQWDSAMNYPFREAAVRFVAQRSEPAERAWARLEALYWRYGPTVSRNMMNLLSSHDTPRFLTLCGGDRGLAKLGATLLMAWPGAPSVYYGDELGMEGGPDPDNRRGMRWDLATDSNDVLAHYRALIAARNASRALQSGDPALLHARGDTLAFARVLEDDLAVVALHRGDRPAELRLRLPQPANSSNLTLVDALSGKRSAVRRGVLVLTLPARSSALLVPARGSVPAPLAERNLP